MGESVSIVVGNATFTVCDGPSRVDAVLSDELSWEDPDARHVPAYQNGHWDGTHKLYDRRNRMGPVGLLPAAVDRLESEGCDVRTSDIRRSNGTEIETDWNFEHGIREYQREAVESIHENGGGVVSIPTGGGKTVVALRAIHEVGKRSLVVVPTQDLLYQWSREAGEVLGITCGFIGDGTWGEEDVTVASVQTIVSRGAGELDGYDVVVFDECHRTSAAETYYGVGTEIGAATRIGLSATPWRKVSEESMKIEAVAGPVVYEAAAPELIDAGFLSRPEFRIVDPKDHGAVNEPGSSEEWNDVYRRCVGLCPARNAAVTDAAADLATDGYSILVSVDRIAHGKLLEYCLSNDSVTRAGISTVVESFVDRGVKNGAGVERSVRNAVAGDVGAEFLSGTADADRREETVERFESGDIPVLISTLLREGVDIPELNAIVLAGGGRSDIKQIQQIGRALRPKGGDHAVVVDFEDSGKFIGEHYRERRDTYREYYGKFGPAVDVDEWAVREYIAGRGIDVSPLSFSKQPDGTVRVVKSGWVDDFDAFLDAMRSWPAASYDADEQTNYVDPSQI